MMEKVSKYGIKKMPSLKASRVSLQVSRVYLIKYDDYDKGCEVYHTS